MTVKGVVWVKSGRLFTSSASVIELWRNETGNFGISDCLVCLLPMIMNSVSSGLSLNVTPFINSCTENDGELHATGADFTKGLYWLSQGLKSKTLILTRSGT